MLLLSKYVRSLFIENICSDFFFDLNNEQEVSKPSLPAVPEGVQGGVGGEGRQIVEDLFQGCMLHEEVSAAAAIGC